MKAKLKKEIQLYVKKYREIGKGVSISFKKRTIPKEKIEEVNRLKELLRKYRTVGLINIEGIPTKQFKELRKLVSDKVFIRVIKNNLLKIAIRELKLPNSENLVKYLKGSLAAAFTNLNAFELKLLFDKVKVKREARPGDVVTSQITVPAGNTGIPPGPMISIFGKLKIPTQVREGTIWIAKDTTVAKVGDVISPDLASLLQKLDIEPIEVKLNLKVVYENGLIFTEDQLKIDIGSVRNDVTIALTQALNLASEIVIPEKSVIELALIKAFTRAVEVASQSGYLTMELVPLILNKALLLAYSLASLLSAKVPELGIQITTAQPSTKREEKKEGEKEEVKEEEKKETLSEEELSSGLSALFG